MREPTWMGTYLSAIRRIMTTHWRILVGGILILALLGGFVFSARHQIHQFIKALTVPSAHPVHVTPLALTPGATTSPSAPLTSADWTTYHQNNSRTGLVANTPDPSALARLWSQSLDGAVYAEPLVVDGTVVAATENDSVYALSAQTGKVLWRTNVGKPVPLDDLPCGDIDPLGITGTPVYDPHTGLVFAVAEIQGPAHLLVGLDVTTGQVKVRRLVDPLGIDPLAYQQRAALALSDGNVYISFGGLYGDCGDYRGTVVASRTDGSGLLRTFQVPTTREGAIWSPAGPTLDAQGNLYVSVGNGAATGGAWDHTDSVLKLSPELQLEDSFAPQRWAQDNASDLDLGSLGPVFLANGLLFIQGKSSQGYLLHAQHLGGVGGEIETISVCAAGAYGGAAGNGSVEFIPCADGLRQINLGADGKLSNGWQAPNQVTGSPVVGGNTVYSLNPGGGTLYALNAATGSVRATVSVGMASRFATPILSSTTLYVGTLTGIVAVGIVV
jgi:outer membrane protein assembly factor BamB